MAYVKHWIPACAGMTMGLDFGLCRLVTAFLSRVFQAMTGLFVHCHAFCFADVFFMSTTRLSFQREHACH